MGYAMAAQAPGGAEVIRRIEIGEITPAAGEVVIEHEAIGVNFIDIYIRTGAYPWPVDRDLILGSEAAGTVPFCEAMPASRQGPHWILQTSAAPAGRVGGTQTVGLREGGRRCSSPTRRWLAADSHARLRPH